MLRRSALAVLALAVSSLVSSDSLAANCETQSCPGNSTCKYGQLLADESWVSGGQYLLQGDVTVPAGVTLTIEPGAIVKTASYSDCQVGGDDTSRVELIVLGNLKVGVDASGSADPSKIVTFGAGQSSGSWAGIVYKCPTGGCTGSPTHVFKNADLGYGYNCIVNQSTNSVVFEDSAIHHCSGLGINVANTTSSVTLKGSAPAFPGPAKARLHSNGSYGVQNLGALTVSNAAIFSNSNTGVYSTGNSQITGCAIYQNGYGSSSGWGVVLQNGLPAGNQTLSRNVVHQNYYGGLNDSLSSAGITHLIDHNTFETNDARGSGYTTYEVLLSFTAGTMTVQNNIAGNNYYYGFYRSGTGGAFTFSHNLAWNNYSAASSYNWGGNLNSTGGTGAQNCNPLYVKTDGTNYRITSNSPALGADSQTPQGDIGALPYISDPTPQLMGILRANLTLTAAGSPWALTGDLVVSSGVTLTLEPGAVVNPSTSDAMVCGNDHGETELIVKGALSANGSSGSRIQVRPSGVSPSKGSWSGIWFDELSTGNVLNYLDVGYGNACVRTSASSLLVENTLVHHCAGNGLTVDKTTSSLTFKSSPQNQAASRSSDHDEWGFNNAGALTVAGTTIASNRQGGVNSVGNSQLTGNEITANGYSGAGYGVYFNGSLPNGNQNMSRNTVHRNYGGGLYATVNSSATNDLIDHNTFDTNDVYNSSTFEVYANVSAGTLTIRDNNVTNNTWYGIYRSGGGGTVDVHHNNSWNNYGSSPSYNYGGSLGGNGGAGAVSCNPLYVKYDGTNYRLTENSPSRLADSNGGAGDLGALPWLGDATVGLQGILRSDTTLTAAAGPYALLGDYVVAPGVNLTIEPGTVINPSTSDSMICGIDSGRAELHVQGTLTATGTSSAPITFKPAAASPSRSSWYGIYYGTTSTGNTASYLDVGYGHNCVTTNASSLTYSNCRVHDCGADGVTIGQTTSSLTYTGTQATSAVRNNTGNGIRNTGALTLVNTTISSNGNNGVLSTGNSQLNGNEIAGNGNYTGSGFGVVFQNGLTNGNQSMSRNTVHGNYYGGLSLTIGQTGITDLIEHNTFDDNDRGSSTTYELLGSVTAGTATIRDNLFTNNDYYGVYRSGSGGTFDIHHNNSWNNGGNAPSYNWGGGLNSSGGVGALHCNPLYVKTDGTNYRLTENSPAREADSQTPAKDMGALFFLGDETPTLQGHLHSNKTLTAAGSPYSMPGDLFVLPGVTLTLEAGARLVPASGLDGMGCGRDLDTAELIIQGSLVVNGTAAKRAEIYPSSRSAGQWTGLRFEAGSAGNSVNYLDIGYGSTCVNVEASGIVLSNTRVRDCTSDGVLVAATASLTMTGEAGKHGGNFSGTVVPPAGPLLESAVYSSGQSGSAAGIRANGDLTLANTDVYNNRGNNVTFSALGAIAGNRIHGSSNGYGIYAYLSKNLADVVQRNLVYSNYSGGIRVDTSGAPGTFLIDHNTIDESGDYGIFLYHYAGNENTHTIRNNIVSQNNAYGIYKQGGARTPTVDYNNVWNNGSGGTANYYGVTVGAVALGNTAYYATNPLYNYPQGQDFRLQPPSPMRTRDDGKPTAGDLGALPFIAIPVANVRITPSNPADVKAASTRLFAAQAYEGWSNFPINGLTYGWAVVNGGGTVNAAGTLSAGCTLGKYAGTVQATTGGVSGTTDITLVPGNAATVGITPGSATVGINQSVTFVAAAKDSCGNATSEGVNWSITNPTAGVIDANGVFTANVNAGTFKDVVKATTKTTAVSNYATVTVTPDSLAFIQIAPSSGTVNQGSTGRFSATGKDQWNNVVPVSPVWSLAPSCTLGSLDSGTGVFTAGTTLGTCSKPNGVKATQGSIVGDATVTVAACPLTAITITPATKTVDVKGTIQLSAVGRDSCGNTNVPITPAWSVSGGGTIDSAGLFTAACAIGSFTVTATQGSATGTATVSVTTGAVASIVVAPSSTSVAAGTQKSFSASGKDACGNTLSVTPAWTVVAGGGSITSTGVFTAGNTLGTYTDTVRAAAGPVNGFASVTVVAGPLATITVSPHPATVSVGSTQQFTAVGADAAGNPVSISPTWSVGASAGTISPSGLFTAGGIAGTYLTSVKATMGGVTGSATVTVNPGPLVSIVVAPNPTTLPKLGTQQFTAVGKDAGGNTVPATIAWSVTAGGGTIDGSGIFTAGSTPGSYANTVQAAASGIAGKATVNVAGIAPETVSLAIQATQQFTAVGFTPTSWSVVNGGGTINPSGLFIAGSTTGTFANTIKASSGAVSVYAGVTVTPGALAAVSISPASAAVGVNGTQQFTAAGKDAAGNAVSVSPTWSVLDSNAGTIDTNGLFTAGTKAGTFSAVVKATSGSIFGSATVTVTPGPLATLAVSPTTATVVVSGSQPFTASGQDAHGNTVSGLVVSWSVVNGGGTISSIGRFTAGTVPGTYTNTVQAQSGSSTATATVVVNAKPLAYLSVSPSSAALTINGTQQFTATGRDSDGNVVPTTVTWSVVTAAAGTIDASGLFTASARAGSYPAAIKAVSGAVSASASVTVNPGPLASLEVTPGSATLTINQTQKFTAVGKDSGGNTVSAGTVQWWLLSGGGTLQATGNYTAPSTPGSAVIKATSGAASGTANITINSAPLASIGVAPSNPTTPINGTVQYTATGKDTQGNVVPVTVVWSLVFGGGAIDQSGLFTAGTAPGTFVDTIKATAGAISARASVTVTPGPLASIGVAPTVATVTINGTQQFTAIGKDSAGNTAPVTPTWKIDFGGGSIGPSGLFTAPGTPGSTGIVASSGSISGKAQVTVVAAPLASLSISPNPATIAIGQTQQFSAAGKDTQGNTVQVPVTWSIVNGGGTIDGNGLFTAGNSPGTYSNTVKATSGTIGATASVGVTSGPLTSLAVTPSTANLGIGGVQQFSAMGKDAAGNTVPVSPTWSIVSGGGTITSTGLFTAGTAPGTYTDTVKASSGSVTATASVVVNPGSLSSISITPNPATTPIGRTIQFAATGKDSAGNTVPVNVSWSVVGGGGTITSVTGLFTAGTAGGLFSDTIKAQSGAISGTASVTVTPGPLASLSVTPGSTTLVFNGTQQFTAAGRDAGGNAVSLTGPIAWSVANGGGTISANGFFTAGPTAGTFANTVKAQSGSATGTATVVVNAAPLTSLSISPDPATLTIGGKQQFTATGKDANGNPVTTGVNWSVLSGGGSIDQTGTFTAGTTAGTFSGTVKAASGNVSAVATVVINPGAAATIAVSPGFQSLAIGATQQYQATAKDAGGNTVATTVTWSVTNGGGLIDAASGLFTAATTAGTFANTIRASAGAVFGAASITVKAGTVAKLSISPTAALVAARGTQQFTATASDAFGNAVPASPSWSLKIAAAGTLNTASGLFTAGAKAGSFPGAVEASFAGVKDTADVVVTPGSLDKITVSPATANLKPDQTQTFAAEGQDADGNPVTFNPSWSIVGNAGRITSAGVFTAGQVPGSYPSSVKATASGISGFASVNITAKTVARVSINPLNPTLPMGRDVTFTAKAFDSRDAEITGLAAVWSVLAGGGTINGTTGVFRAGLSGGTFNQTVQVAIGGVTATTSVTIPADYDADGIPDNYELTYGLDNTNPADARNDLDGDKLSNLDEFRSRTNPKDADSDDDGVLDGNEVKPSEDADGDGLPNALDPDSDNDGLLDGTEMAVTTPHKDTDPAKRNFIPDADPSTSTDPLSKDTDGDTLPDGKEDANKNGRVDPGETDPNHADKLCPAGSGCGEGAVCANGVCVAPSGNTPDGGQGGSPCNPPCTAEEVCNRETAKCEPAPNPPPSAGCGCGTPSGTPLAGFLVAIGLLGISRCGRRRPGVD